MLFAMSIHTHMKYVPSLKVFLQNIFLYCLEPYINTHVRSSVCMKIVLGYFISEIIMFPPPLAMLSCEILTVRQVCYLKYVTYCFARIYLVEVLYFKLYSNLIAENSKWLYRCFPLPSVALNEK